MRLRPLLALTFAFSLLFSLALFGYSLCQPELPKTQGEVRLYSTQMGDDLRSLVAEACLSAKERLDVAIFNFSDASLLKLFKEDITVPFQITADKSAYGPLKKLGLPVVKREDVPGIMHQKIVIIDGKLLVTGSVNFTKESLQIHENLMIATLSPPLCRAIQERQGGGASFACSGQNMELWLLPEDIHAEARVIELLGSAHKSIKVAMFTFTSWPLARALVEAHERGIEVTVALDRQSAKGTSKKIAHFLKREGIRLFHNQNSALLHHKFAVIDDELLITGSANWTASAFCRNGEILLVLRPLLEDQQAFMQKLWSILTLPSKTADEIALLP